MVKRNIHEGVPLTNNIFLLNTIQTLGLNPIISHSKSICSIVCHKLTKIEHHFVYVR